MDSDPLLVIFRLASVFDALGISYLVGGSMASSLYGIPRASNDVDVVAEVKLEHVDALVKALKREFYVSPEMILDAVLRRNSFNVIHLPTMFKADIFIPNDSPWAREEMKRAKEENIPDAQAERRIRFASPEDTILQKLAWYRLGGEVSQQQCVDVEGVLKVQGASLDFDYLERWAAILHVSDLLQQLRESGNTPSSGNI